MPVPRRVGRAHAVGSVASTTLFASRSQARSRAISVSSAPLPLTARIVAEGDSLTSGFDGVGEGVPGYVNETPWPTLLAGANPSATVVNIAVSGKFADTVQAAGSSAQNAQWSSGAPANIAVYCLGSSDIFENASAAAVISDITSILAQLRAAHPWTGVIGMNLPERGDLDAAGDAKIVSVNSGIAGLGFDVLIDLFTLLGSPSNSTIRQPDLVHLKTAGQQLVADAVEAAVRSILGI